MTSFIKKENHKGSAISKILRYTQTDRHPVTFIKRVCTMYIVQRTILNILKKIKLIKPEDIHK